MTNQNDSFIDEVTEELRRDRLFALLRRWGWVVGLVIAALVAGSAWREYSRNQAEKRAQGWGDAVIAAETANAADPAARSAALAGVDAQGSAGRAVLGAILAADAAVEAGDTARAAALLEQAATDAGSDVVLRDLARLKSVIAQGAAMDPAARDAALAQIATPGAPYELLGLEQQAVALADAGRTDAAVALIRQIQQKDGQSDALRRRLAEMLIALGAEPEPETTGVVVAPGTPPADAASPAAPAAPAPAE